MAQPARAGPGSVFPSPRRLARSTVPGGAAWAVEGMMTEVDLGRVVDSRRFIDLLPWQAGFLNAALVSEFTNRQALNKSRRRGSSEDSAS